MFSSYKTARNGRYCDRQRAEPQRLFLIMSWGAATTVLLILGGWWGITTRSAALLGILCFVAALVTLTRMAPTRAWSPAVIFLVVVGVFHLGLAPYWIWGIDAFAGDASSARDWFYAIEARDALYLVSLGITAFTFGASGSLLWGQLNSKGARIDQSAPRFAVLPRALSTAGAVVLLSAILLWFIFAVQQGGLGVLIGSYSEFLDGTQHLRYGLNYLFISIGLGLIALSPVDRVLNKAALFSYILFAVVAFFLGLRGEVLFPLALYVTVLGFHRRMPRPFFAFGGGLLLLTLINAGREIRKEGLAASSFDWANSSPLGALRELGSSLRVVATSVNWHDYSGEEFKQGATYLATVSRFSELLFAPHARPPAQSDFRLMNVEILARIGPAGGSIIGEAHHNFSTAGVAVVLFLVGTLFGVFSKSSPSAIRLGLYVVIAAPLFSHVRNSFVPVVPAVMYGIVLVLGVTLLIQFRVKGGGSVGSERRSMAKPLEV